MPLARQSAVCARATILAAALALAAPPAPAQGLFDQIQELGRKIQESVPKNDRPAATTTTTTAAPRDTGSGGSSGGGGISAERRAAMVLQSGLNTLGYDAGAVDGLPGAQTRAAIGRFQAARGFDATGALTPAQRRVFDTDVARVSGDRDDVQAAEIAELQAYLAALGYSVGTPDGAYGPRTAAALDAFRRDTGLPGGAGPTVTDKASLYAQVHGVGPMARPAGTVLLAAPAPGQPALPGQTVLPAPTAPTAAESGPSFDCALALSDAERAICADPRLATLDRQLAAAWSAAAAAGTPAAEQRAWLADRNACGTDAACLQARMLARLDVLTGGGTRTAEGTEPAAPAAAPINEADRVHIVQNRPARLPAGLARRILMAQIAANPATLDNESTLENLHIDEQTRRTGQPRNAVSQEFRGLNMIARDDVLRETRARLLAEAERAQPITADNPIPVAFYLAASAADYDDAQGLVLQPLGHDVGTRIESLSFMVPLSDVPGIGHVPLDRASASALLDRITAEGQQGRMLMRVAWGRITGLDGQMGRAAFELDEVDLAFVPRFNHNMADAWTPRRPEDAAIHTWTPAPETPAEPETQAPSATRVDLVQNQIVTMPDGFERRVLLLSARATPRIFDNTGLVQQRYIADRMAETGESEQEIYQQFYALNTLEQEDILRAKRVALMEEAEGVPGFDTDPLPISVYLPAQITTNFDPSKGLAISVRVHGSLLGQPIAYAGLPDLTHMAVTRDDAKTVLDRASAEANEGRQFYQVVHGRITGIGLSERGGGWPQVTVEVARVTAHFLPRYRSDTPFEPANPEQAMFTWQPAPVIEDPGTAPAASPLGARLAAIEPVRSERLFAEAIALQGGDEALYARLADTFHEVEGANEFDKPAARAAAIETLKTAGDGPIWIEGTTRLGEYDLAGETFAVQGHGYLRWRVNGVGTNTRMGFTLVGPDPFAPLPVPPEIARPIVEAGDRRDVRFMMRVVPMQVAVSGSPTRPQYNLTLRPEEVIFYRDGERDPQTRQPTREPLVARNFAAENAALDDRLARRFEASEFDGLAARVPDLSPHVLDLIAVRAGSAPGDAMALHSMMLAAWQAQEAGGLPGPAFFEDGAAQPAADDAAALLHPSFRSYLEAKAAALGDRFTVRLHDQRIDNCGHAVALERFYGNNDAVWQTVAALPGTDTLLDVQRARNESDAPVAAPLRIGHVQQRPDARYGCASWIGLIALKDGIYQPRDAGYTAVAVTFALDESRSFDGPRDVDDQVVLGTVLETRPVMADGSLGDPLVVPEPEPEPEPAPEPVVEAAPAPAPVVTATRAAPAPEPVAPRADPADWPATDAMTPALSEMDLMDLRTGLPMAEADAILREAHDGIIGVFETSAPPAGATADGPGPLDYRRVYLMRDGQEAVTLASYAPGGPVMAVMRRLVLDQGTLPYDRIEAALTQKYGDPATRIDGVGLQGWGPGGAQHCFALPLEGHAAMLAPVPGTGAEGLDPMGFRATQLSIGSLPVSDRAMLEACGPVLVYMAERPEMWGASGFSATLIDQGAMARAVEALAPAPQTVDIEIEF